MKQSALRRMDKLRQVMALSVRGKGIAAALVETFRESGVQGEVDVVRSILLGRPVDESSSRMATGDESDDLLDYLAEQAKVNASEASRRAERLAWLFEHWVRAKEDRLTEQRIMETRSLMVSAILGGVTAMVASLAPVLSDFQFSLTQHSYAPGYLQYLGMMFVVPASFFLGLFFSPKRALLDVAVAGVAYALVVYFFSPLVLSL